MLDLQSEEIDDSYTVGNLKKKIPANSFQINLH